MGTVDYARLAKDLKPYLAAEIRTALNAALTKAALPTVGGGSGSGGITPPGGGTDVHVLASTTALGSKHTVSGLTAGMVLRALSGTTAAFGVLQHGQLGGVGPNDHHNAATAGNAEISVSGAQVVTLQSHDIVARHSYSGGAAYDVFGLSAPSTIARLSTSADVSAGATAILRAAAGVVGLASITSTAGLALAPTTNVVLNPGGWVQLNDGKALRTLTFVPGFAGGGLQLDQGVSTGGVTSMEVDNLTVRGVMNVYELLIHKIRATNGSVFVSNVGKIASRALYSGSEGAVNSQYTLNVDTEMAHGFAVDDLIRAQKFTGTGVYQSNMLVVGVYSSTNFRAQLLSGNAPQVGYEYVRLGNQTDANRQGGVYLTADDSGAPYIDVWDGVNSFTGSSGWSTTGKTKVRVGRLDGITGATNQYGLWAGSLTTGNVLVTGDKVALRQGTDEVITLASNGKSYFQREMWLGPLGGIYQGSGTFASPTTGLKIFNSSGAGHISAFNAGNEVVNLNGANGLRLQVGVAYEDVRSYQFVTAAGASVGILGGNAPSGAAQNNIKVSAYRTGNRYPTVSLLADGDATYYGQLLFSTGTGGNNVSFNLDGNTGLMLISANVEVSNPYALRVGGVTTLGAALDTASGVALELKQDGQYVLNGDSFLQLGNGRATDGTVFVDLVGDTTYTDYGLRVIRNTGANGTSQLRHRGTGELQIRTEEAADIKFLTAATLRATLNSSGLAVAASVAVGGDGGGTAGYTTFTNATVAASTGTITIRSRTASNGNNAGYIKVYIGGTAKYIPYVD